MKQMLFALGAAALVLSFAHVASAEEEADFKASSTDDDGSYAVDFKDDLLNAPGVDPNAAVIRGTWRPVRFLLMRPRLNFVSELRKSVESI